MSHGITTKDKIYVPRIAEYPEFGSAWHKLETVHEGEIPVNGTGTPEPLQSVIECGIRPDYDSPLTMMDDEQKDAIGDNGLDDHKIILADQRLAGYGVYPLSCVKKTYVVHQNRDLFESLIEAANQVFGAGEYIIASIGTLGAFARFFVSLFLKGHGKMDVSTNGQKDVWSLFYCLSSSHDSSVSNMLYGTTHRPVCDNTIGFGHRDALLNDRAVNIKHTKNSLALVTPEMMAGYLNKWLTDKETLKSNIIALQGANMSIEGFRSFCAGMFSNGGSDKLATTSFNRIGDLSTLFVRGKGNQGKTRYDALNAVTEYFTHGRGVGGPSVSQGKRFASASFGRGEEWKQEAFVTLTNQERLDEASERGKRLYLDYASN